MEFRQGKVVKHKLNGDYVMMLEKGKEQYKVRLKNMETIYVYPFELEEK